MPVTDKGYFDFSDAPGSAESLDDIFASTNEPTNPVAAATTTEEPKTEPVTATSEPFLKTTTGTVYNTADDAVKGVEHKDALITQLRQELLTATKVDPLKKKPEGTVEDDPSLVGYMDDADKYFADIQKATNKAEILKVQAKFVNEQLAPYAPIIATVVRSQAVDKVTSDIPTFRTFLNSQEYKDTLENFPLLKTSIEVSEMYPERSGDLPQLYRMAFDAAAGRNLPRTVQATTTVSQPVTVRPTVTSTPSTPPPVTSQVAPPTFANSAGRQAIMEQQKAAGVENLRF